MVDLNVGYVDPKMADRGPDPHMLGLKLHRNAELQWLPKSFLAPQNSSLYKINSWALLRSQMEQVSGTSLSLFRLFVFFSCTRNLTPPLLACSLRRRRKMMEVWKIFQSFSLACSVSWTCVCVIWFDGFVFKFLSFFLSLRHFLSDQIEVWCLLVLDSVDGRWTFS